MEKKLTIGMATYDDFDGVYFTIQALRMYHNLCNTQEVEYVIVDTNPSGAHGQACKKFIQESTQGLGQYIPKVDGQLSSFNKYEVVKYSKGKYVIIMDCHVFLESGSIDTLMKYYDENPDCKNLVQGPLLYDDLTNISTNFDDVFRDQMYGIWETKKEEYDKGEPFEIPMQGMGFCSFERKNFPKISEHFRGFGAEEGYISEKFRMNGGKNVCIPQLKWCHRFGRPNGVPFPLTLDDRVYNYFIGWLEMYRDANHPMVKRIYEHFKTQINEQTVQALLLEAMSKLNLRS